MGSSQTDDPAADDDNVERGVIAAARSGREARPTIPVTESVGQWSIPQEDMASFECSGRRVTDD